MSGAVANVRNIITIDGVDNASDAVNKARKALGLLEGQAEKTGKATNSLADNDASGKAAVAVRELSGDLEGALKGLGDFAGGSSSALSAVADRAGAAEAIMRLLPGPIGLATTAVVGLAFAGKLMADHYSEADAKMRLLVSGPVKDLAKDLKLDADGAVALQQAFDALDPSAIRPSADLLKQVGKNAKEMGGDAKQAMIDLVSGFKGSDQDVARLQGRLGSLGAEVQALDAIAKSLGFDNAALGLTAAKSAAEQLKKTEEDIRIARANADKAEADRRLMQMTFEGNASNQTNKAFLERYSATIATADAANRVVKNLEDGATALADTVAEELRHKDVLAQVAAIKRDTEQQALLAADKETAKGIRLEGIKKVQDVLGKAIASSASETSAWAGKEADSRWDALKAMLGQEDVAKKQIADAEKTERKAAQSAAAGEARANRQASTEAKLAQFRASIDRDGLRTEKERLDLLDREQAKELEATRGTKNAKVRAEQRLAIEADYAAKREALTRELDDAESKTEEEHLKTLEEGNKKSAELVWQVAESIVATSRARSVEQLDILREEGQEVAAAEAERELARREHAEAMLAIDRDLAEARKNVNVQDIDYQRLGTLYDAKRLPAIQARDAAERKYAAAAHDRAQQARQDAASSLEGPAAMLKALGSIQGIAVGDGLSIAVKGFQDLDVAMGKSKVSAEDVANTLGSSLGGLATVASDAETKRTLAQLDADTKRRLSTATTEEERAAITAEGERKKAEAVEASEKRQAAIMVLTEGAKAIASFASGNVVAGVGHTAAAAAFGAVAGGAFGGSSGGAGGASSGGAVSNGGGALAGVGNGSGQAGGQTINVVLGKGFVIGTPGQVGKGVASALGSLKGTGLGTGKGV